jgi:hypothetical protein
MEKQFRHPSNDEPASSLEAIIGQPRGRITRRIYDKREEKSINKKKKKRSKKKLDTFRLISHNPW